MEAMYHELAELAPFAAPRDDLFSEEQFLVFQWCLCQRPDAGDVIPETGGCHKIRWKVQGKGKSGGIASSGCAGSDGAICPIRKITSQGSDGEKYATSLRARSEA